MVSPKDQRHVPASAARRPPRSTSTSAALTAASVLRSTQKRSDFGLLPRPILAEHDPDHDQRAGRNRAETSFRNPSFLMTSASWFPTKGLPATSAAIIWAY